MITLTTLTVAQPSPSFIRLTWEFESTTEDYDQYTLSILKSEEPSTSEADYEIIASGLPAGSTFMYDDTSIAYLTNKFADYFYRVKIIDSNDPTNTTLSDIQSVTVRKDKISAEIIRRKLIVLKQYAGATAYVLKRKSYGTVCPVCYDVQTGRTTIANCTTCYGVGYLGGYYSPLTTYCQINEGPSRNQLTVFGEWEDSDAIATFGPEIPLNVKDVICDKLGRRWTALTVRSNNHNLYTLGYQVQMRLLDKADPANLISVI